MSSKQKRYLQKNACYLQPKKIKGAVWKDNEKTKQTKETSKQHLFDSSQTHGKPPPPPPPQCRRPGGKPAFHPTQQNQSIHLLPMLGFHQRRPSRKSGLPPSPAVARYPCPSQPGYHPLRPSMKAELPSSMSRNTQQNVNKGQEETLNFNPKLALKGAFSLSLLEQYQK